MPNFSQGKWRTGERIDNAYEYPIFFNDNKRWERIALVDTYVNRQEAWANAKLIAAAPEMYEAIKMLLDELPIIAGDSRHDTLVLAMHKAQKLLDRIDGEEDNKNV